MNLTYSKSVTCFKFSFSPLCFSAPFSLSSVCLPRAESEGEEEEEEEEEEVPLLSEEELNKLGSKLIKAEIMGNTVRQIFITADLLSTCFNSGINFLQSSKICWTALHSGGPKTRPVTPSHQKDPVEVDTTWVRCFSPPGRGPGAEQGEALGRTWLTAGLGMSS